jgi:hypothetical protein
MGRAVRRTLLTAALVAGAIAATPASALALDTTIESGPPDGGTIDTATARFTFSSPGEPVAHECAIDDVAKYTACDSPYTTPVLPNGSHTFHVRAQDSGGGTNPAASRQFTVAVPPPAPQAVKPVKVETTGGPARCVTTTRFGAQARMAKNKPSYCGGRFMLELRMSCPADSGGNCSGDVALKWINPSYDKGDKEFRSGLFKSSPVASFEPTRFDIAPGQTATLSVGIGGPVPPALRKAKKAARKASKKATASKKKAAKKAKKAAAAFQINQSGLPAQEGRVDVKPPAGSAR